RSSGARSWAAIATSAAARRSTTASCSAISLSSPTTASYDGRSTQNAPNPQNKIHSASSEGSALLVRAERACMQINSESFKAYDVRGVYPSEVNEDAARAIGAAFVVYLKATRIAVCRDMRLSSPEIAAAFIDGATSQGCDVVDYGMTATDMMYFAVAKDE